MHLSLLHPRALMFTSSYGIAAHSLSIGMNSGFIALRQPMAMGEVNKLSG